MKGQVSIARPSGTARHSRGQVSTELLVIVAVVLVIFIPLLVMVYFKSNEANAQIGSYQAELAVFRLAYLANSVGALGTDTSLTADIYIPKGVKEIRTGTVGKGGEITFVITTDAGDSEISEVMKYPVNNATFVSNQGWARFNMTSQYINGEARIRIERE